MASYPLILLLVTLTACNSYAEDTSNTTNLHDIIDVTVLDEMQGLRFEEIGKVKLIKKFQPLVFEIDMITIEKLIKNASIHVDFLKDVMKGDADVEIKLKTIEEVINLKKMEFEDTIYGLVKTEHNNEHSRKKRSCFFGLAMCPEEGEKISEVLNVHKSKTNEMIEVFNHLKSITNSTTNLLNKTVEEVEKKTAMIYLKDEKDEIERIINSITKMLSERRLNNEIVTIDKLDDAIKKIALNTTDALPYHRLIDYYYNLRLDYKVENNIIFLGIEVPIVEKSSRNLSKIVEIPARNQDKLIITDVTYKYIAYNENETAVFMTMDTCYISNESMYYCKTQSPIKSRNASDCLTNALFGSHTIDMNMCKYSAVHPSSLLIIKLNDGVYFYYTPENETLNAECGGRTSSKSLIENTSGIIELEPDCVAFTSTYKLITTKTYKPTVHKNINVVRVIFDIDQVRENMKNYNTPIVSKFYIESLGILREMSAPTLPKIEILESIQKASSNQVLQYATILASLVIVVYVVYNVRKLKSKNHEVDKTISKMPMEEPVDYYVITTK